MFRHANPANRIHVTEKPPPLMREVVQICEQGGRILDPFAGAGTPVLAAVQYVDCKTAAGQAAHVEAGGWWTRSGSGAHSLSN